MNWLTKLGHWHQTKRGLISFAIAELALAYGFVSLSIDRGNLLYYLLTLICLIGFFKNLLNLSRKLIHAH